MQFVEELPAPADGADTGRQTEQSLPSPQTDAPQRGADTDVPPTLGAFISNVANALMQRIFPFVQPPPRAPGEVSTRVAPGPTGGIPAAHAQTRPQPPGPIPFIIPPIPLSRATRAAPAEKRQWVLPSPPGLTLRERVEKKERALGLRCSAISCGLGPSDEDPVPVSDPRAVRQVPIRALQKDRVEGRDYVCACE